MSGFQPRHIYAVVRSGIRQHTRNENAVYRIGYAFRAPRYIMTFVPADGSIAKLFPEASKALQHVCDSLTGSSYHDPISSESQRCRDEVGRLEIWDIEIGARDGQLDHALRNSSRLRDTVLELLRDLVDLSSEST